MGPASTPSCRAASATSSAGSRSSARAWSYPLSLMHAEAYAADRLALIGDAAHVIHPIAGQGPQSRPARTLPPLAQLIVDARRLGLDIGNADSARSLRALASIRQHGGWPG